MEAKTQVVRIRRKGGKVVQDCDIYIGRKMTMGGWNLPQSKWANPFPLKKESDRATVLAQYEAWIRQQPQLMASLEELRGKTLGCWCKPKACHGDILVRLMKEASPLTGHITMRLTGDDRFFTRQIWEGNMTASRAAQKGLTTQIIEADDMLIL